MIAAMNADDEIFSDEPLVRRLLKLHAPDWAELQISRLQSSGTDNALYRLGETLLMRLPRRLSAISLLEKETVWLPQLTGLPLEVPKVRLAVCPSFEFEFGFTVFDWLDGDIAECQSLEDTEQAAQDMAQFLKALQVKSTVGAPVAGDCNHHRGVALSLLSTNTLEAIEGLADEIDVKAAKNIWHEACALPFQGKPAWLHGDLKSDNLIAREGRLSAVIDWGLCAVGDPAADNSVAWSWVEPEARDVFQSEMDLDESEWLRAKGWALYGAAIALNYYRGGKNEALCEQSRRTLMRLGLYL
ncbi:MAG: aminoglycoside phosphotransferase family protein [Roseibium sp.]|uniref:aminoglycoside phosphotransferase family protein n=1 Tax=Roseibium sp. TaxID=1936156 RepID=UPI00262D517F|nr:aminoglycoside phosphotransferase family protein [Roseibium sp.]MCV0428035.1 aminoglycoside phosphotransferase family protein [Roseibium sp.]